VRYLPSAIIEELVTPAFAIECVEEAYLLFGIEREVLARPSAAITLVRSEPPRLFTFKGCTLLAKGVTGHQFGAQFGEMHFYVSDNLTGELRGILDHSWLNKRRTGATAAVAARHLAASGARKAALIGAGGIGEQALLCLDHAMELTEIFVAARTSASAESLVQRAQALTRSQLTVAKSAREAVEQSDIVVTITVASSPVIEAGWLKPGALLCAMGGAPELHFDVLGEADRVIVDDASYAFLRGSFASWISAGQATESEILERIDADIGQIVAGHKPGRTNQTERILAVVQGMAICDLVIADRLLTHANKEGLGYDIPFTPQPGTLTTAQIAQRSYGIADRLSKRRPASNSADGGSAKH